MNGAVLEDYPTISGLTVTDSLFDGNKTAASGGAIQFNGKGTSVLLRNSTFVNNQTTGNTPENVGSAILVGNHSGGLPFDATMVAYALSECAGGPRRIVRPLYDRFVEGMGPVRDAYRKLGGVPARYAVADEF